MDTKTIAFIFGILLVASVIFGCAGKPQETTTPTTPPTTPTTPTTPTPTETLDEPQLPGDSAVADVGNWGNDTAIDDAVGGV